MAKFSVRNENRCVCAVTSLLDIQQLDTLTVPRQTFERHVYTGKALELDLDSFDAFSLTILCSRVD